MTTTMSLKQALAIVTRAADEYRFCDGGCCGRDDGLDAEDVKYAIAKIKQLIDVFDELIARGAP